MVLATVFTLSSLLLWLLCIWGVGLTTYVLFRWLIGTVDRNVDERQEMLGRLASFLDSWQLPRLAEVVRKFSSINISGAIRAVRNLVDAVMPGGRPDPEAILSMLKGNFFHQIRFRLEKAEERAQLIKEVLAHPQTRKEITEALKAPAP